MQLSTRRLDDTSISFNLYKDLAAFARCGLKQHDTLYSQSSQSCLSGTLLDFAWREAIHHYFIEQPNGPSKPPPWSHTTTKTIIRHSERRMVMESILPPHAKPTLTDSDEAITIINEFGSSFFPLLDQAGVLIKGARLIPTYKFPSAWRTLAANWCEISACADIITHTQFSDLDLEPVSKLDYKKNALRQLIRAALPRKLPSQFEIIVVYKGGRRPLIESSETEECDLNSDWNIDEWCIHTLAHLRSHQDLTPPVIAGMVIYLNELCPAFDALAAFVSEMEQHTTDIVPPQGSYVEKGLLGWNKMPLDIRSRANQPQLPFDFRLKRAVRFFDITSLTMKKALKTVDDVVIQLKIAKA